MGKRREKQRMGKKGRRERRKRKKRREEDKTKEETIIWFQESSVGKHMLHVDSPNYRSQPKKKRNKEK